MKNIIFLGRRKYLSKTFFRFFGISGPTGSGKPDASYLGGSLGKEEPKDTSSMRIGPAVPPTHTSRYSYFNQILHIIVHAFKIDELIGGSTFQDRFYVLDFTLQKNYVLLMRCPHIFVFCRDLNVC